VSANQQGGGGNPQEEAKINVNTMPLKLIQSLVPPEPPWVPMTEEDALQVAEGRLEQDYDSVQNFLDDPNLAFNVGTGNEGEPAIPDNLDVATKYFLFFGETMVGDHIRHSKAMLFRDEQGVQTIRRTDANF